MKVLIRTDVYEQLEQKARANNIKISDLADSLLDAMLNHHHQQLKEIIKKVKEK